MDKPLLLFYSLILAFTCQISAQTASFIHTTPINNSEFVNPDQVIVLRSNSPINNTEEIEDKIEINGSLGGNYDFRVVFPKGDFLLNIVPSKPFQYGESVEVRLSNIKTVKGDINDVIRFKIMVQDNLQMLREYRLDQNNIQIDPHRDEVGPGLISLSNTPSDYPDPEIVIHNNIITDQLYFITLNASGGAPEYKDYLSINDSYGTPVFYRRTQHSTYNFTVLWDGRLSYAVNRFLNPELERYYFLDSAYVVIDSIKTVGGYNLDAHDMLYLENGNYLLMSYDPQVVDMSTIVNGGKPYATVIGLVIQEVDIQGNLYFQWRSWDHFEITDATDDIDLTALSIDYVHGNSFEIDTDGNILLSSRHLDEITKINRTTGDIIYRMGLLSKNNEFTFIDDEIGFSHQHDARVLPNGNITIYDNGNLRAEQYSRALEYEIDEFNRTAKLVWSYRNNPDIYAAKTGCYRQASDGTHLIGWGVNWPQGATELLPDNTITKEILFPNGVDSYRILRNPWETNLFKTPEEVDFGNYYNQSEYKKHLLPIANNSNDIISISSKHLLTDDFVIMDSLPIEIPPYDTVNVIIGFKPSGFGDFSDRLTVNYDQNTSTKSERIAQQTNLEARYDQDKTSVEFNPVFGQNKVSPDTEILIAFSDPIRNVGGELITNKDIENMFIIKKNNQWGNDIGFTGTLSNNEKVITLIPDSELPENASVFVELKASQIENINGEIIDYPEATYFETGMLVGDGDVIEIQEFNIFPVPVSNSIIVDVSGVKNYKILVTSIDGYKIFESLNNSQKSIINSESFPNGIYIVTISTPEGNFKTKKIVKL